MQDNFTVTGVPPKAAVPCAALHLICLRAEKTLFSLETAV